MSMTTPTIVPWQPITEEALAKARESLQAHTALLWAKGWAIELFYTDDILANPQYTHFALVKEG